MKNEENNKEPTDTSVRNKVMLGRSKKKKVHYMKAMSLWNLACKSTCDAINGELTDRECKRRQREFYDRINDLSS